MGGQLHAYLSRRSKAGTSFNDIALEIVRDYDVDLTGETVRRWIYAEKIEANQRRPREDAT
jgi:hypothetical protein